VALLIAFFILMAVFVRGARSRAQGVCGDGAVDSGEQCDDGNLTNGDGCSARCTTEQCGNGIADAGEQCDDGEKNGTAGDTCSKTCFLSFCGDGHADANLNEECDDGSDNGSAGDPCTSECKLVSQKEESSSSSAASSVAPLEQPETPQPVVPASAAPAPEGDGTKGYWLLNQPVTEQQPTSSQAQVTVQAKAATQFLSAPAAEDYKQYFSREENLVLEGIVKKLASGRRLTKDERVQAGELSSKFQQSKFTERDRYISLLKDFVTTSVSSKVVAEQNLSPERLITPDIPTAILELSKTARILKPEELRRQVVAEVSLMKDYGMNIEPELTPDYQKKLEDKTKPVQVFMTLKAVKEAAEKHATTDLKGSLSELGRQAGVLRQAVPVLEREYGIKPAEIEPVIDALDKAIKNSGQVNVQRVVENVDRLLLILEQRKVVTKAELAMETIPAPHAAAAIELAQNAGWRPKITASVDVPELTVDLTAYAPEKYKPSFEQGTFVEQKSALINFLKTNDRLLQLLNTLRRSGRTDMDRRYQELINQIELVGSDGEPASECSYSVNDALGCTDAFLKDLEAAARSRGTFTNFIGTLQDFFGIGS